MKKLLFPGILAALIIMVFSIISIRHSEASAFCAPGKAVLYNKHIVVCKFQDEHWMVKR